MIEYRLNLGGTECSVVEWNPDADKIVFAMHGWLDNLASFETLAQQLPNLRLIAFDFPGHGHSNHIELGKTYHFLDGLYLIDDLIYHFKLTKVILLGHSMGGAVATVYAAVQPDLVENLLLIEALGPVTSDSKKASESLSQALSQRRQLKHKRKPTYQQFSHALQARAVASEIKPELIKPLVERALIKTNDGYTWRADARLRLTSALKMSESQLRSMLPNINCPTMLIEAESGYLQRPEAKYIQQRKPLVKDLHVELMPGGHHLHLESPAEVAEKINQFLSD
jgi:pimeloyl-ACP methyl ester carboxylesterase